MSAAGEGRDRGNGPVPRSWGRRLADHLSKQPWQGIGAIAAVLGVLLALLALLPEHAREPSAPPVRQDNGCGIHGDDNDGNSVDCSSARLAPRSIEMPSASAAPTPPAPVVTPTVTVQAPPPATSPTAAGPGSGAPASQTTFPATDFPTYIALYEQGAQRVAGQAPADYQVEAGNLSPLNGAKAATADAGKTCASVDYTSFGVGFDVQRQPSICVLSRTGATYLVEIRPSDNSAQRPLPYLITIHKL